MHFILMLGGLVISWAIRCIKVESTGNWSEQWQRTLAIFLLPLLLLCSTAIAILWMGPYGRMVWAWEGWFSYGIAISFLGFAVIQCLYLTWKGNQTLHHVRTYPMAKCQGLAIRIIDISMPYSAQIGFWHPELVVSRGLLETLGLDHLGAVLAHECAHFCHRDTFLFFGLGWVRRVTAWLPQTEPIWQELLVLRELRADRWAADRTDALLLAEALLLVVEHSSIFSDHICAPFSNMAQPNRLAKRIDALLTEVEPTTGQSNLAILSWLWLFFAIIPLLVIPFHY